VAVGLAVCGVFVALWTLCFMGDSIIAGVVSPLLFLISCYYATCRRSCEPQQL